MKTISAEQFKSKYGDDALKKFAAPVAAPQEQNYLQRTGAGISENLKAAAGDIGSQDGRNALSKGISAVSHVASAAMAPIAEAPGFKQVGEAVGKGIDLAGRSLADTLSDKFNDSLAQIPQEDFSKATQPLTDIANTGNIANTVLAAKGTTKGADIVKNTAQTGLEGLKNDVSGVANKIGEFGDKITDQKIGPQVKTILPESPVEKFDRYVKAGQKAITDPRELTPLEHAGNTAVKVAQTIKEDLGNIGKQKSATLESIKNLKLPDIATRQIERLKPLFQQKLTTGERGLLNQLNDELSSLGKNPTAGSVDATIDRLQSELFEKSKGVAVPATPRIKAFVNSTIKALNDDLKSSVDKNLGSNDYSTLNSEYSTRVKMFQALNKALGEDGNKGGSLLKRFFSPQDSGTKNLFSAIKEKYGVDLGQDATIAKFVMDTLGDTRAKSLLQLPPTTPMSAIQKGLEYAENKLTSPEKVFNKARSMTRKPTQL